MTAAKIASRDITHWLHQNFMVIPDDLMDAAGNAWRSLQAMERADNRHEISQQLHRRTLQTFAEASARWCATR